MVYVPGSRNKANCRLTREEFENTKDLLSGTVTLDTTRLNRVFYAPFRLLVEGKQSCRCCGRLLNNPEDPVISADHGGDCLWCMAAAEDPECVKSLLTHLLSKYDEKTGVILYVDGSGKLKDWAVGAHPQIDDENTLKEHLKRNLPNAAFIGGMVK
jgi:hypothetical protein